MFQDQEDGRVERAEERRADPVDHGAEDAAVEMEVEGIGGDEVMGGAALEGLVDNALEGLVDNEMNPEPLMSMRPARIRCWADEFADDDDDDDVIDLGAWGDCQTSDDLVSIVIRGAAQVHEPTEQVRRLC